MMYSFTASALALASMAASVNAHGFLKSPTARMPGDAFEAACGTQVYNNMASDHFGNVQTEYQVAGSQSDYDEAKCNLWMCKGFMLEDNKDNVQTYTAGQSIDMEFEIRAPHTGTANVSIIDTKSGSIIGTPLKTWDSFASTSSSDYTGQTKFSITMPEDLGDKCTEAGACVLSHWWDSREADQTYISCVDFTVGGSGSGSSPAPASSSAAASSAPAATTSVTAKTKAAETTTSVATATSAAPSATASSSSSSIPEGLTLEVALQWVEYLYSQGQTTYTGANAKRSVRSFRA